VKGEQGDTQSPPVAATKSVYAIMLTSACSMLRDIEHLVGRVGKIEGFDDLGTYLVKIIEGKKIKAEQPAAPLPGPVKEE
jgi:hypothetical protein